MIESSPHPQWACELLGFALPTRCDYLAVTDRVHRSLDPGHMYPGAAIQQPSNISTDEDLHERH